MIEVYCSSVGVKKKVGGFEAACASCLKLVSTIHATGAKNSRPAAQARTVSRCPPIRLFPRRARGAGTAAGAAVGETVAVLMTPSPPARSSHFVDGGWRSCMLLGVDARDGEAQRAGRDDERGERRD